MMKETKGDIEKKRTKKEGSKKKIRLTIEEQISKSDYYGKYQEFALWLKESKGTYEEEIKTTKELRELFKVFVKQWNRGELQHYYYAGVHLEASSRSRYAWKFAQTLDAVEQGNLSEQVQRMTDGTDVAFSVHHSRTAPLHVPLQLPTTDATAATTAPASDEPMLDDEDRRIAERKTRKRVNKEFAKRKETVMEELVPKPTGKDALLEKKKQISQYHRKDDDDGLEHYDAFNDQSADSIHSIIQRNREKQSRITEAKKEAYEKKLAEYKAKEEHKLEQFRSLLHPNQRPT